MREGTQGETAKMKGHLKSSTKLYVYSRSFLRCIRNEGNTNEISKQLGVGGGNRAPAGHLL